MSPEGRDIDPGARTLGDFRLIREIGRGGMGVVYVAEQGTLRRTVALKVLPIDLTASPARVERFKREAESAARLHHSNIVPIFAAGAEEGQHWIAMEFVEGTSLDRLLDGMRAKRGGGGDSDVSLVLTEAKGDLLDAEGAPWRPGAPPKPAPAGTVQRERSISPASLERAHTTRMTELFEKVARALHHAHEQGIIHRDVKPGNILLDMAGEPRITDFGLAHEEGTASLTRTGDMLGTPLYMSPEQLTAKRIPIDRRTDVYSLGVSLYQALTLRPPFEGESSQEVIRQILFADPAAPRKSNPRVPRDLETIVLKSIEKNPERRYRTSLELAEDLHRFLREEPIQARRASFGYRVWKKTRSARVSIAASIGIATAAAVAIFLLVITLFGGRGKDGSSQIGTPAKLAHEKAVAALKEQNFPVAFDEARRAVELQPDVVGFHETLGDVHAKAGNPREAADAYGRALALERPGSPARERLHARYATLLGEAGRSQEAIREWTAILADRPEDTDALHGRGLAHKALGQNPDAIRDFEKEATVRRARADGLLSTLPVDPTAPITPDQVKSALEAEKVDPRNTQAILHLAYDDLRAGRAEAAMGRFDTLVEDDPVEAHLGRARASCKLGNEGMEEEEVEGAVKAVDKALALAPDHVGALLFRSALRSRLGQAEGALADAEKAARLDPRSALARLRRGAARFESGDRKGAREDFEAASLDAGPSGRRALLASAVCALGMDEAAGARAILDRALAADRADASALLLAGVAAATAGDFPAAVSHFTAAVATPASPPEARVRLAFSLLRMGRLAEAWPELDAALDRSSRRFAETLDLVVHGGEGEYLALLRYALKETEGNTPVHSDPAAEAERLRDRRRRLDPRETVGPEFLVGALLEPSPQRREELLGYARALDLRGESREIAVEGLTAAGAQALPILREVARDRRGGEEVTRLLRRREAELDEAADALVGEWLCVSPQPLPPAVAALKNLAPRWLVRALRASPDTIVGARAREAILGLERDEAASAFAAALGSPAREAKLHALVGLAELADPSTSEAVEKVLDDPDPILRTYAVHAYAAAAGRQGTTRLRSILMKEADPFVREMVVRKLAASGDRLGLMLLAYVEKRPTLEGVMSPMGFSFLGGTAPPPEERSEISETTRIAADLAVPSYLARALRDPDVHTQAGAARALSEFWKSRSLSGAEGAPVQALGSLVFDFAGRLLKGDPRVRIASFETLARGGDTSAFGKLARLVEEEEGAASRLAAQALARLCGGKRPPDAPFDLASLPPKARRAAAETLYLEAEALPEGAGEEALRLLERAADVAPEWQLPRVRAAIAGAEKAKGERWHAALAAALADPALDPASLEQIGEHRRTCPRRCGPASEAFERLSSIRPEDPLVRARLAAAFAAEGRKAEARPHLEFALARGADDVETLVACARACWTMGEEGRTYDLLRKALDGGFPPSALGNRDFAGLEDPRIHDLLEHR
jgi:serine/threonine protein kinase/predicted Zn-dependent protease